MDMTEPEPFGWFHIMWLIGICVSIFILYKIRDKYSEKQLKTVLGIYSFVVLILEILKQLIWSFNFDAITGVVTWDYQWYSFPFQLCTTPMYVCLLCFFLKKTHFRDMLLSYVAYITILGSIATILMPADCFTTDTLVNFHTSWLHFGSFVISLYLLMSGEIKININAFRDAIMVFVVFVLFATLLNMFIYNTGILNEETFNMFYISPYFESTLPVFNSIQPELTPFGFVIFYLLTLSFGGFIIYSVASFLKNKSLVFH